jgi:Phage integrase, N-terminal SAM-like domain
MLTVDRAIDLFLGDLTRRGATERTRRTYARLLDKFCDRLPDDYDVSKITTDDCRRWLDTFASRARGTQAHAESVLASFLRWLYLDGKVARNPMDRVPRTNGSPLPTSTSSPCKRRKSCACCRPRTAGRSGSRSRSSDTPARVAARSPICGFATTTGYTAGFASTRRAAR